MLLIIYNIQHLLPPANFLFVEQLRNFHPSISLHHEMLHLECQHLTSHRRECLLQYIVCCLAISCGAWPVIFSNGIFCQAIVTSMLEFSIFLYNILKYTWSKLNRSITLKSDCLSELENVLFPRNCKFSIYVESFDVWSHISRHIVTYRVRDYGSSGAGY